MKLALHFDIQSFWHIGNGQQGGSYADVLALKDEHNLPYIPGRAVKGLVKEAFNTAVDNQWFAELQGLPMTSHLFGFEGEAQSGQGLLRFSSAKLSQGEQAYFMDPDNELAYKNLYQVQHFTAIENGVAKETSLRSMEVAVPMVLTAEVELLANPDKAEIATDQLVTWLTQVCPLVTGIGAKRQRGFGQVNLSVEVLA